MAEDRPLATWIRFRLGGRCNAGAFISEIGFWGFLITNIVQYAPQPIVTTKVPSLGCSIQLQGFRTTFASGTYHFFPVQGFRDRLCKIQYIQFGSFRKLGVLHSGARIIRTLLFRVLY